MLLEAVLISFTLAVGHGSTIVLQIVSVFFIENLMNQMNAIVFSPSK